VKKSEPDKTRDVVARSILESGPTTAVALAEKLDITPAGIRRHLDSLIAEGVLTSREPYQSSASRSRGRPSKVFLMTDEGREKFEHSYDDLAASEFPQLCEAETEAFSKILGTHVQRLATIADGDGVCTTFVPTNISQITKSKMKEGAR